MMMPWLRGSPCPDKDTNTKRELPGFRSRGEHGPTESRETVPRPSRHDHGGVLLWFRTCRERGGNREERERGGKTASQEEEREHVGFGVGLEEGKKEGSGAGECGGGADASLLPFV